MGRRRSGGSASGPGKRSPSAYLWRRHYLATFRVGVGVFAAVEFTGGVFAFLSTRVHNNLGLGTPVVDPLVPVTAGAFLAVVGFACYGVVMRPRSVGAVDSPRSVAPPRGGARWPGVVAAGVDGGAHSAGGVT